MTVNARDLVGDLIPLLSHAATGIASLGSIARVPNVPGRRGRAVTGPATHGIGPIFAELNRGARGPRVDWDADTLTQEKTH
jgi:hypothetical protein